MPMDDGTGPSGKGPKSANRGVPTPRRRDRNRTGDGLRNGSRNGGQKTGGNRNSGRGRGNR